ncbi:hypothetical protein, partial [Mycobacterium gordonae]|uniref:hypothetical protein n=1 Tax=Mycobacterium gordonae TaxID=1778 RepID=UPI001E3EDD2B
SLSHADDQRQNEGRRGVGRKAQHAYVFGHRVGAQADRRQTPAAAEEIAASGPPKGSAATAAAPDC